jgi:hypothetical protein
VIKSKLERWKVEGKLQVYPEKLSETVEKPKRYPIW